MHDVRRGAQRNAGEVQAELFAHAQVHLVVHQPQRHLRNLGRELLDLDAVKLIDVDADQPMNVHAELPVGNAGAQHLELQQAQLAVADDEEVAAAAGRVKKREQPQFFVKLEQLVSIALDLVELGPQLVQKQRLDELEDVLLAGVVRSEVAARLVVHDRLEQRTEDRGRDRGPVQRAAIKQGVAHGAVEAGNRNGLFIQFAVHIGKGGELLVEIFRALVVRGVEHLEKQGQLRAEVGTVLCGALVEPDPETAGGLEDAGVLSEQTEQQAHQQDFQRMAFVAAGAEPVVQLAHALGGLDVDRVLWRDDLGTVARDEGKMLDTLVQVGELEFGLATVFQIVEPKALEVGHQDVARQVALGDAVEVVRGLREGAVEVGAAAFVLDQQHAFPEGIDAAVLELFARPRHGDLLLEYGDALALDAEHGEKIVPEALCFGAFGFFVNPPFREFVGAAADFVPGKRHGRYWAISRLRGSPFWAMR